ncbi:hypothetical protein PR048_000812 [Dryococelus australis]|uniref:Uncharacterized protein n=1 Tax=Dryococelus australis TaxID=614101 RepID=A0ABQ9IGX0_9NEOP|nr:hypothetical protein PR048_000812 [Dryococelus australis]
MWWWIREGLKAWGSYQACAPPLPYQTLPPLNAYSSNPWSFPPSSSNGRKRTAFTPTSVQSMSHQSQCSRVLQAPSRTVGFTRRFHTLSSIQATNTSPAVVPHSPVVVHTYLRSCTLGQAASVKDFRSLGYGRIIGLRPPPRLFPNRYDASRRAEVPSSLTRTFLRRERRSVTPASLAAVGIHKISKRQTNSHERIIPKRGEGEVDHLPRRRTAAAPYSCISSVHGVHHRAPKQHARVTRVTDCLRGREEDVQLDTCESYVVSTPTPPPRKQKPPGRHVATPQRRPRGSSQGRARRPSAAVVSLPKGRRSAKRRHHDGGVKPATHAGDASPLLKLEAHILVNRYRILLHRDAKIRAISLLASHQGDPGSIPRPGHSGFSHVGSCRTMPLVGRFSRGSPVSPTLSFSGAAPYSPQSRLTGSQDLDPDIHLSLPPSPRWLNSVAPSHHPEGITTSLSLEICHVLVSGPPLLASLRHLDHPDQQIADRNKMEQALSSNTGSVPKRSVCVLQSYSFPWKVEERVRPTCRPPVTQSVGAPPIWCAEGFWVRIPAYISADWAWIGLVESRSLWSAYGIPANFPGRQGVECKDLGVSNIKVLRPTSMEQQRNACRRREIPDNIRPAASSGTIPTCENPRATPPGSEPVSPRWEAIAKYFYVSLVCAADLGMPRVSGSKRRTEQCDNGTARQCNVLNGSASD